MYPSYAAPVYAYPSSGFGLTIGGPNGVLSIGSGGVYPSYGYSNYGNYGYSQPYYGGGYGGYGRRW